MRFLLTKDESGPLQSTIFERLFRESGHVLYESSAYLLEGRVEQDPRRGFSFVVERIEDLATALERAGVRAAGRPHEKKARRAGQSRRRPTSDRRGRGGRGDGAARSVS